MNRDCISLTLEELKEYLKEHFDTVFTATRNEYGKLVTYIVKYVNNTDSLVLFVKSEHGSEEIYLNIAEYDTSIVKHKPRPELPCPFIVMSVKSKEKVFNLISNMILLEMAWPEDLITNE